MTELLNVEIQAGNQIAQGDYTITPFSQSVQLLIPGRVGGFIWNRPVSVLVQDADGGEKVIPIQDVTRIAQLSLIGTSIGLILIIWLVKQIIKK